MTLVTLPYTHLQVTFIKANYSHLYMHLLVLRRTQWETDWTALEGLIDDMTLVNWFPRTGSDGLGLMDTAGCLGCK